MRMFDYVSYNGNKYQTRHTLSQCFDNYEIRNDQLWYEDYDTEWVETTNFGGYIEKINFRWTFCKKFIGEIRFYKLLDTNPERKKDTWEEYSAYFYKGQLKEIHLLEEDETMD